MKKQYAIYLLMISAGICLPALAQKGKKESSGKAVPAMQAYLGKSDFYEGKISKENFDSLLRQGIMVRDSSGNEYPVHGFYFNYAERNLYEDSVGNLMML